MTTRTFTASRDHPRHDRRRVIVTATGIKQGDYTTASCIDTSTGGEMSVVEVSYLGRKPRPGDVWMVSPNYSGFWSFVALEQPARADYGQMTFREVLEHLEGIGLIDWEPFDAPDGTVERPYLAYLGECRLFAPDCAPAGWLPCDGSTHTRTRYRELWHQASAALGAGNGSTTFTTPDLPNVGPCAWYLCAE